MADAASAKEIPLVSREQSGNAIGGALRLFVGRGRRYSVKQLSNATSIKDRVIECAMTRADSLDYRPLPQEAMLSITKFLGADFTNEWIKLCDQGAFDLPDEEPDPGDLAVDASEDAASVVRITRDGKIDGEERKVAPVVGARMMARGAQLVALAVRA